MENLYKLKYFVKGDRINIQAQQIWLILVSHIESTKLNNPYPQWVQPITYGEVASLMKREEPNAGFFLSRQLGILGNLCLENSLPPINCIVVNKNTGVPGSEVVLTSDNSLYEDQRAVFNYDWFSVRVPTTGMLRSVWENRDNWK
ncbi:TPA: hypothetical protein OUB44_001668 [Providencia rettgeri]|nr:hypothetical protein [Providencia rettgeri]